jgi:hypothetical protein
MSKERPSSATRAPRTIGPRLPTATDLITTAAAPVYMGREFDSLDNDDGDNIVGPLPPSDAGDESEVSADGKQD